MLPRPRPPPIFVLSVVFGKLVPNPIRVPNLKLLASTVAEIRSGSQFISGYFPGSDPANFGPKRRFGKLVPKPICVYQISTVAEKIGGPKFFSMLPWPRPPPILVLNVVFCYASPKPKLGLPNLKLLASTVAKLRRKSQIFWMLLWPRPTLIFVLNVVFW